MERSEVEWSCVRGAALDRRLGWQEGAAAGGQERVERKIASGMARHL
jgi:hypothetical protein